MWGPWPPLSHPTEMGLHPQWPEASCWHKGHRGVGGGVGTTGRGGWGATGGRGGTGGKWVPQGCMEGEVGVGVGGALDWMLGVGLLTQGGLWPLRPCPPLTERPLGRGAAGSPGPHRLSRGMAALEPLDLASCLSRKPPDFLLALRRSTRCYQKEGHLHTRSSSQCRLRAGRWPRGACSPDPGWSRAHGLRGSCSQEPTARWPVGTGCPRAEACGRAQSTRHPHVDRLPARGTQPAQGRPVCIPGCGETCRPRPARGPHRPGCHHNPRWVMGSQRFWGRTSEMHPG